MNTILPPPPPKNQPHRHWHGLCGSSLYLAIAEHLTPGLKLIITPNLQTSYQAAAELQFFEPDARVDIFPDWEVLPYDHFSAHEDIISARISLLNQLNQFADGYLIIAISSLMHRLPPKQHVQAASLHLKINQSLDLGEFKQQLLESAYQNVDQVIQHGQFSHRGSIIDLFPMGADLPYRIELFDDEIDSLRTFDPDTQKTIEKIPEIHILSGREFPLNQHAITTFRQQWRAQFEGNPKEIALYNRVSAGHTMSGIEFYIPLFFDKMSHLFDYLPASTTLILIDDVYSAAQQFIEDIKNRYEQYRYDLQRPILPPTQLYLLTEELFSHINAKAKISIDNQKTLTGSHHYHCEALPDVRVNARSAAPLRLLNQLIDNANENIMICAESAGRQAVLEDILREQSISFQRQETWHGAIDNIAQINLITAPLHQGFIVQNKLIVITESELFGATVQQQQKRKTSQDPNNLIKNLIELQIGSPVVHIQHGIGRYQGLTTLKTGSITAEYLTLEYANHDKIYVPVAALQLISRYTGGDSDTAPLHRLGSTQWQKAQESARKKIRDVAAELLQIYSLRANTQGFSFPKPDADFQKFKQDFPFSETQDQTQAIEAVIGDMTSAISMDRLICGDVGFGKTEVAMQASFVAVNSGKQVAVLVPTTLLANQHFQNFTDRFAHWPVKVGVLSRLQTPKQQKEMINQCKSGMIDIIIGTHKLLQPSIEYKDLGLLIVDEEQRFGVRDKERIKSLRANIDILTLTATPIPRTLNMALSNTRDLSIIATPPQRRLSINTFVYRRNNSIIKEAIMREVMRGGQIYFLHNNVKTMPAQLQELCTLCPDITIEMAHGQMREKELEKVMSDFYHQKFQLLIASTIIESGIDIPSANTIIIDRADKLGLAQLHQIRGRVGRSHHQAYAYLLLPTEGKISKDAEKRLDAIESLEDLGAGFLLATHDMEIRGAGELLGDGQSGQMHAIGFSLYMDLLEQAVQALKSGTEPQFNLSQSEQSEVDLGVSTLLPSDYIFDVNLRLNIYKRLANCENDNAITALKIEIIDRFGPLPEETINLINATEIQLYCKFYGVKKSEIRSHHIKLHFNQNPNIDQRKLIQLIQKFPREYQLKNQTTLHIPTQGSTIVEQKKRLVDFFVKIQLNNN